jgi:CheY-like chemotaxis protein
MNARILSGSKRRNCGIDRDAALATTPRRRLRHQPEGSHLLAAIRRRRYEDTDAAGNPCVDSHCRVGRLACRGSRGPGSAMIGHRWDIRRYNRFMVDHVEFARLVREALSRLDDRPCLQVHDLGRLLGGPNRPLSAQALRLLLLQTIEELQPLKLTSEHGVLWRRYRYLRLRYVDGVEHEQIAKALSVSVRQARRDHMDALGVVASLLWERLARREAEAGESSRALAALDSPRSAASQLDGEIAQVASDTSREPVDLGESLGSTLQLVAPLALERGVALTVEPHPELPCLAVNRIVLRQLLIGLLGHAVESAQHARIRITLSQESSGQAVTLGLAVIRLDPTRGGPSLLATSSLAAVRHLAESQAIALKVEGVQDAATVQLTFPAIRPKTVLVIDDNPDIGWLFGRYVERTNYRTVTARTGQRALVLAHESSPDVIVLDLMMPTQDGWEILQALKASPETRSIPVIVCSVLPERAVALALGVADFLDKPVSQDALLAALERCSHSLEAPAGHPEST